MSGSGIQDTVDKLREERDQARYDARILAHAWKTDSRPPSTVVKRALGYPPFDSRQADDAEVD